MIMSLVIYPLVPLYTLVDVTVMQGRYDYVFGNIPFSSFIYQGTCDSNAG